MNPIYQLVESGTYGTQHYITQSLNILNPLFFLIDAETGAESTNDLGGNACNIVLGDVLYSLRANDDSDTESSGSESDEEQDMGDTEKLPENLLQKVLE